MSLKRRKPKMLSQKEFGKTDMTLDDWEVPLVLHVKTAAASPCPMAGGVVSHSCLTLERFCHVFFSPFLVLYPRPETPEVFLRQYRHWTRAYGRPRDLKIDSSGTNLGDTLQRALEADGTQLLGIPGEAHE